MLATGDVHVVPLRAGLGSVSVPSKTYSILAAGRPVVAAIDPGTEVPAAARRRPARGVAVPPDDPAALRAALRRLLADARGRGGDGRRRPGVGGALASPAAVAAAYEALFRRAAPARPTGPCDSAADSLARSWPSHQFGQEGRQLAHAGKGKKVRFQGGTVFPAIVVVVVIVDARPRRLRPHQPADRRLRPAAPAATTGTRPTASTSATTPVRVPAEPAGHDEDTTSTRRQHVYADKTSDHRYPQPRRRRDPLPPVHQPGHGQPGHARRVPRRLRRQAHRHQARAPGEPGRPDLQHGDVQVQRRGHPAPVRVWDSFADTERLPRLRHRLQQHPHRPQRHGVHHRRRARRARTSRSRRRRRSCPSSAPSTAARRHDRPCRGSPAPSPGASDRRRRTDAPAPSTPARRTTCRLGRHHHDPTG